MDQSASLKETDEHRQMRRIAFVAVVVSTVAVIASVVTLPMLYNYVQSFQSHLMVETDYCKARSRDMWLEMTALQIGKGHANRIKRGWFFGQLVPENSGSAASSAKALVSPTNANSISSLYGQPASPGYGPITNPEPAPVCCTCHQVNYFYFYLF